MDEYLFLQPGEAAVPAQCRRTLSRFGLTLTEEQCRFLEHRRRQALSDTGRVELADGILPRLAMAFCDSPYIRPETWAETLALLQDAFYRFKTESRDRLTDGEVLALMRRLFDGRAGGDPDFIAEAELETLLEQEDTDEI